MGCVGELALFLFGPGRPGAPLANTCASGHHHSTSEGLLGWGREEGEAWQQGHWFWRRESQGGGRRVGKSALGTSEEQVTGLFYTPI